MSERRFPSIGEVVGERLRDLRKERGITQEQASSRVRELGVPWTREHVVNLELRRRADITIGELLALSAAFGVGAESWFLGPGRIRFSNVAVLDRAQVRDWLHYQEAADMPLPDGYAPVIERLEILDEPPERAEARAAKRLGVSIEQIKELGATLWGHDLVAEREARVATTARADDSPGSSGLRPHVTRQLLRELREALADSARLEKSGGPETR